MANFVATTVKVAPDSFDDVAAAMEVAIEVVVNTAKIRVFDIYQVGPEKFRGLLIWTTA